MDDPAEGAAKLSSRDARAELQNACAELRSDLSRLLDEKVSDFEMLLEELNLPSELPAAIPLSPATPPKRDMTKELMDPGPQVEKSVWTQPGENPSATTPASRASKFMRTSEHELFVTKKAATASQRNFRLEQSYQHYVQKGSFLGILVDSVGCRPCMEAVLGRVDRLRALQEPARSGCCTELVQSAAFQFVITAVILANCVTLLISANWAMQNQTFDIPEELRMLDLAFTIFYVLELLLRFYVHRLFFFWREDWKWNVFDFVLVVMAVQEQVVEFLVQAETASGAVTRLTYMRSLRVVRVSRILRLLRAIRVIRELRMMVFSIISSFTALFWCLVLITLVICMFALFFLQLCTDYLVVEHDVIDDATKTDFLETFGSLDKTMKTLYLATTGGFDWERSLHLLELTGSVGSWAWLFYIAFFNFALFNVLTGMFVDHAMKWSQSDNQNLITEHRSQELQDASRLQRLCEAIDTETTGRISWEDFEAFVSDESALIYLASLGLEIHDAKTFFDMLAGVASDKYIDIDTFVKGCMRMKGPATSIDMLSMAYEVTLMHRQNNRIERTLAEVQMFHRKASPGNA
ncbi:SCN8A [Symbiodinium natans]|uniref:SCN8A protein n=1 Tax=Symbiodinium natans TaxID=878477 RepID=A0A812SCR2_9DINO|nr:SCN8A [Symbiodinium natans]